MSSIWKVFPLLFLFPSFQLQQVSKPILDSIENVTTVLHSVEVLLSEENEYDIKELAHFLKEFGPVLKALTPATQLILSSIESGEENTTLLTEELSKINEQLELIETIVHASMQPYYVKDVSGSYLYWDITDKIRELERRYKFYLAFPGPYASSEFRRGCITHNPVDSLDAIHTKVAAPLLSPGLFPTIIAESGYDNRQLTAWAKLVSYDSLLSAYLSLMCLGIDLVYDSEQRDNISNRQLVEIADALVGYQRDLQVGFDVQIVPDPIGGLGAGPSNQAMASEKSIAIAFVPMMFLLVLLDRE